MDEAFNLRIDEAALRALEMRTLLASIPALLDESARSAPSQRPSSAGIADELEKYIRPDGVINGAAMRAKAFPLVTRDVFLSHSRRDLDLARRLARWLLDTFGLTTFIDSDVWDYGDRLLEKIDRRVCLNPGGETFSYELRNRTTSHMHMMLATSLSMAIEQSKCVFFLNTPESVSSATPLAETESPWIFYEVATVDMLLRAQKRTREKLAEDGFRMKHLLPLGTLTPLSGQTLRAWAEIDARGDDALRGLYQLCRLPGR